MTCTCQDCQATFTVCGRGRLRCHPCRLRVRRAQWRQATRARRDAKIEAAIDRHLAAIRARRAA